MRTLRFFLLPVLLLIFVSSPVSAQESRTLLDDEFCDDGRYSNDREDRYCEVREITLPANRDVIVVDGGRNGGISVEGWNRENILVRARVTARARSESRAEDLAMEVEVVAGRREIYADVPHTRSRESVAVSYRVFVPVKSNLELEAHNGGISISDVEGEIDFDTMNGGISLDGVSGDVKGTTRNGGLDIQLAGSEWKGAGLDVETRNGGVEISVPEDYSADLITGTVNGRIRVDFPITVQGDMSRRLSTTLGDGGRTVRAVTTNGGVKIRRD